MTRKISIVHQDLSNMTGMEKICMNVMDFLQEDYKLLLITSKEPDIEALNEFFGTNVGDIDIEVVSCSNKYNRIPGPVHKKNVWIRKAKNRLNKSELVFSTDGEFCINSPCIQYIHFPNVDYRAARRKTSEKHSLNAHIGNNIKSSLNDLVRGFQSDKISGSGSYILTNSEWTNEHISAFYGVDATVLYPPVGERREFTEQISWENKEDGFVLVSRLTPYKNIIDCMNVINSVVDQGFNTHLHIVGPTSNKDYSEKVRKYSNEIDHINFEGEVSRKKLKKLLNTHKYGIHGTKREHFGIAIAEMVAHGQIPFVHNSGGPPEIVNGNPHIIYESTLDCVEKMKQILHDEELQYKVLEEISNTNSVQFNSQFQNNLEGILSSVI